MAKWQKIENATHNHWIASVIDTINGNRIVVSYYFDGTQRQALAHFRAKPELRERRRAGYQIVVNANSLVLWDGFDAALARGAR